jgi:hypothetical protein
MEILDNTKTKLDNSLVGAWFHSVEENKIRTQGQIIGKEEGYYHVQLYEWLMGTATIIQIVHPSNMTSWHFYNDAEDMRDAYEHSSIK